MANKIVLVLDSGVLEDVFASNPDIEVVLVDLDDAREAGLEEGAERYIDDAASA